MTAADPTAAPAPAPGTSRARALRPALGFRLVLLPIFGVFAVTLGRDANAALAAPPGHVGVTGIVLNAVLAAVSGYAVLLAHTTRVWTEPGATMYEPLTLNRSRFGRRTRADLRSPNTLRIHASAPSGPRPSWRLSITHPDRGRILTIRAPWAPSLPGLLKLLRRPVAFNPGLVTDDETRALFLT